MSDVRDVHEAHQKPETYQKKPVNIEAMEFRGGHGNSSAIVNWIAAHSGEAIYFPPGELVPSGEHLTIRTLEGDMRANVGDFIIKGVSNEFYPCKPKIFWETYSHVGSGRAKP